MSVAARIFPPDPNELRTVAEIIALYLTHTKAQQHPRTYSDRARVLEAFSRDHGTLTVAECRPWHLRVWVDSNPLWRSDWTRKRVIGSVKTCFSWVIKQGFLAPHQGNPFAQVSQRAGERGQPMKPEHFRLLLVSTSPVFRRVLIFLRFTGARPGEMAAAKWPDVDWERSLVILRRHKTATTRKDRRPRVIVLHPVAKKLLDYLRRHRRAEQDHIFVNARGRPWHRSSLALRMLRLRRKCGVPMEAKLHGCRHAFASNAVVRGVDIKALSHLLGHSQVRTTEIYVHAENDISYLQAALAKAMKPT